MKPKSQKRIEAVERQIEKYGKFKDVPQNIHSHIFDTLKKLSQLEKDRLIDQYHIY